ncbi:hypothetical protein A3C23_04510 [Candidatus Roizmanbacteria bacterium RIFCSPHIGHO2_02_FULL_37_13b]|uniref:Uncharacterized protein n=1 Tax=Candidatus Roizmanbacteria bacterium RIFCSPLOWO2_02_FULL_36_11 TaxID=1802071 RepID=A0A1F7JH84_9BACT|nr:MAG: hypothetical protein A3C23_04510 [Candidatus Roizmanbacteria bacterium RIFCSPHIGHO2_02_FULL_37_13b]OGK54970.1 MAG: hypothetical protein A3H78_00655 [Candidatus Roizmanbacteria bacterium RIFCSPLOWO2_02_FULL_36_11]
MSNINKILIAVNAVVIITVIFLGGLYIKKRQQTQFVPQLVLSPTPSESASSQALDNQVIDSLKKLKKGILTRSTLINTYDGKVVEVNTKGGRLPWANDFQYKFALKIVNEKGESNTFYYNETEMKTKVAMVDKLGKPIKPEEIKTNDAVMIEESMDLKKDWNNNLINLKISIK